MFSIGWLLVYDIDLLSFFFEISENPWSHAGIDDELSTSIDGLEYE